MEHPAAAGEDFNLSTSVSTTVTDLARLIWAKIRGPGVPLRLAHDAAFEHDVQRRMPDVEKAARVLGFRAETSLPVMLDEVIAWTVGAMEAGVI